MNIIDKIKNHWPVLILALLVGLIVVLPTILSVEKVGNDSFKGIYPIFNDDENYYNALTREVYDGHYSLTNPYIKEYKTGPYLFPPLPEITYATFSKIFGISITTMAVVNDFLLPIISVLLLYSLLLKITFSKNKSLLLTSLFFLLFISSFNRPISPQFHFIFLLAGLNLMWLIATAKHVFKKILLYNVSLAVVFGILVYSYPFYWMTLAIVYFIWTLLIVFSTKDFKYWAINWLSFFIPAIVFSIPFIVNNLSLRANPLFFETNLRMGFINTHIPGSFFNIGLICLSVPAVYLISKLCNERRLTLLGPALIISGIILNWQNIITGQTFQFPQHFYPVIVLFIFLICGLSLRYITKSTWVEFPRKSRTLIFLLIVFFIFIFYKQRGEIIYTYKNISSPVDISSSQRLSSILKWLENNTPRDSSIYVLGQEINSAIPVYTHNNVYFSTDAGLSVMSDSEIENRWAIQHFFEPVDKIIVEKSQREIWINKFIETYQSRESRRKILQLITGKKYPENILTNEVFIDRVLDAHKIFKNIGFEKSLKTYSVDYLILDKSYNLYPRLVKEFKSYEFMILVEQIGDTMIYKIN